MSFPSTSRLTHLYLISTTPTITKLIECADIMNGIGGIQDGSCTDCDGTSSENCAVASCDTGYHTFVDGVGCAGAALLSTPLCTTVLFCLVFQNGQSCNFCHCCPCPSSCFNWRVINTSRCVYMHVHIEIPHSYTHLHMYTCIYTHTDMYTYTHIQVCLPP